MEKLLKALETKANYYGKWLQALRNITQIRFKRSIEITIFTVGFLRVGLLLICYI